MHGLRCLGEWILVQDPEFASDVADPLLAVKYQRSALDLHEEHASLTVEQQEIALALMDRAATIPGEPVEAVIDLDATRQPLDQHTGHCALAGVLDLFRIECWEQPAHDSLVCDPYRQTSIAESSPSSPGHRNWRRQPDPCHRPVSPRPCRGNTLSSLGVDDECRTPDTAVEQNRYPQTVRPNHADARGIDA